MISLLWTAALQASSNERSFIGLFIQSSPLERLIRLLESGWIGWNSYGFVALGWLLASIRNREVELRHDGNRPIPLTIYTDSIEH